MALRQHVRHFGLSVCVLLNRFAAVCQPHLVGFLYHMKSSSPHNEDVRMLICVVWVGRQRTGMAGVMRRLKRRLPRLPMTTGASGDIAWGPTDLGYGVCGLVILG
jgi:hypothetical protein